MVTVADWMRIGRASRTRTPQVICRPEAPIMRAASTLPRSTSLMAVSTRRA